jgi:hypothetical protein
VIGSLGSFQQSKLSVAIHQDFGCRPNVDFQHGPSSKQLAAETPASGLMAIMSPAGFRDDPPAPSSTGIASPLGEPRLVVAFTFSL